MEPGDCHDCMSVLLFCDHPSSSHVLHGGGDRVLMEAEAAVVAVVVGAAAGVEQEQK